MKKKVGVVGYGGMGQWHVCSIAGTTYLNAIDFNESDVCEVIAIYDIDPAKNEKARKDGYKAYDTLEEFLSDKDIEIVVIATPNDVHESIAIAAMEAGKHVICEKPVTMSCEALENMIAASEKHRRRFSVHQNRRYDDYFVGMKKISEDGTIGDIISIESRVHGDHGIPGDWRKVKAEGGGIVLDWGVHLIDQAIMILDGVKITSVYARLDNITNQEVDDGCHIVMTFENGVVYTVEVGTSNFINLPNFYMRGSKGTAVIEDWDSPMKVVIKKDGVEKDAVPIKAQQGLTKTMAPRDGDTTVTYLIDEPRVDVHDFYRNYCRAIDGIEPQIVTHAQMRRVMKVMETAFLSAERNEVIKIEI